MSSFTRERLILSARKNDRNEFASCVLQLIQTDNVEFVAGTFDQVLQVVGNVMKRSSKDSKCGFFLQCKTEDEIVIVDPYILVDMGIEEYLRQQLFYSVKRGVRPNAHFDILRGTIEAARSELLKFPGLERDLSQAEINSILSSVYQSEFTLCEQLHLSVEAFRGSVTERSRIWNKAVDRLRELGMLECDIRDHFLVCLKYNNERRTMEEVMRLAGAKCFERERGQDPRLVEVLRKIYFPRFWTELCDDPQHHRDELGTFKRLCSFGMVVNSGAWAGFSERTEKELIERKLVRLMSRGKLGQVYELVDKLGESGWLGIIASGQNPDVATRSFEDIHDDCVRSFMERMVPRAYVKALESNDLGSAAALVLAFGNSRFVSREIDMVDIVENDAIREYYGSPFGADKVVKDALKYRGIPIDYRNYYY